MMTSRVRPLIILSTAMLLLAVLLVLLPLRTLFSASSVSPAISGDRLPSVLLVTDNAGSVHLYTGLRQSLAAAGLASQLVILPQDEPETHEDKLMAAADSLQAQSEGKIWLLLEGGAFTSLTVAENPLIQGYIILPHHIDDLKADPAVIEQLDRQPLLLLTSDQPDLRQAGAMFFEKITGEDATLFAASRPAGPDQIHQFRSLDGQVSYSVINGLRPFWAPLDPRISAIIAEEIDRLSTGSGAASAASHASAGSALLTWLTRLMLTGWGLAAVAALIRLYLAGPADWSGRQRLPAAGRRESLIWLPAAAASIGLVFLLRFIWPVPVPQLVFLLLPGAFGLLSGSAASISGRLTVPDRHEHQPDKWLRLCGLLVAAGSAAVLYAWQSLAGGSLSFHPLWLLPAMVIWNLPGYFPGHRPSTPARPWYGSLLSALPFVLIWLSLLIWLWAADGWPAAVTAVVMLLMLEIADQIGRLTAALTGWQFTGRLLRAVVIALLWLHPVVLQGLMLRMSWF